MTGHVHTRLVCKHGIYLGQCKCPSLDGQVVDQVIDCPPRCSDSGTETFAWRVEIDSTGPRSAVEDRMMRDLDHGFRGRVRVTRAEDGSPVAFDPVLSDGEAPPGYVPHEQPVVDHRPGRQP